MKRDFLLLASIRLIPLIVNVLKISDRCWSRWWRVIFVWAWTSPRVFSPFFLDRHAARCRPSVGDRKTLKGKKMYNSHMWKKKLNKLKMKDTFLMKLSRKNESNSNSCPFLAFSCPAQGGNFFNFESFSFKYLKKAATVSDRAATREWDEKGAKITERPNLQPNWPF